MVEKHMQTEIFLELVFSASSEVDEQLILKKSLPLYLRKLNCFLAGVIKNTNGASQELMLIPFMASKSEDWAKVKAYFADQKLNENKPFAQLHISGSYYYSYCLDTYGILILGRKKPFQDTLANELKPVTNHLGKVLTQAKEIEQRKAAEEKLRESEKRLQMSLGVNNASVFENNFTDGTIISSPHLYYYLGYEQHELPVTIEDATKLIHPNDIAEVLKEVEKHSKGETSEYYAEFRMLSKNGNWNWVNGRGKIIERNENGEPAVLLGISQDIAKRKQIEEELVKAKEKAEESDRLKSAFLANMSHEIRTPMNSIMGFAQLLSESKLSGNDQQEYVSIIEQSGKRMLNIINDLIDISKVEAGLMEISMSDVYLNDHIAYIYKFFKPEIDKKGIELFFKNELPLNQSKIKTDSEKLYAILTNLVKNAIKFTSKGSITFGYKTSNDFIEFFVNDTGEGFPNEKKDMIFERFMQGSQALTRNYEGAGLGLSISKAYVEMLGGKIWVESTVGQGSTFYFTLPINIL